jgi:hypothetical protein
VSGSFCLNRRKQSQQTDGLATCVLREMIPFRSEDESNYQAGMTSVIKRMMGSHLRRRWVKTTVFSLCGLR